MGSRLMWIASTIVLLATSVSGCMSFAVDNCSCGEKHDGKITRFRYSDLMALAHPSCTHSVTVAKGKLEVLDAGEKP